MARRGRAMTAAFLVVLAGSAPGDAGADVLVAMDPADRPPAGVEAREISARLGIWALDGIGVAEARSLPGVVAAQRNTELHAASEQRTCAPRPDSPDGFLIPSIRAGEFPPSAPPVAVLDSGVDKGAPEFAGKLKDPVNVVSGGSDVTDSDGHGTRVAGIAVAQPGAVRGVSPTSAVIPVKMLNSAGEASLETFVEAVDAALDRGAAVVNVSAAAPGGTTLAEEDRMAEIAIGDAFTRGALVVAPAGNDGTDEPNVPSAYSHVMSVGATNESGVVATFSNVGPTVDIVAPGAGITTTAPSAICGSGYGTGTGTSFAAAAVSGAAAVLEAKRPELSPSQRFELLRSGARDLPPAGPDASSGRGMLDVAGSVAAPAPATDGAEVDDDVYWVNGPNKSRNPVRLARKRRQTFTASLSEYNDPIDVYKVKLRRGDRFLASVRGASGTRFALGLWSPRTRGFEISDRATSRVLDFKDRPGSSERLSYPVSKAGTYFLSVEAPHTDARQNTYRLELKRR